MNSLRLLYRLPWMLIHLVIFLPLVVLISLLPILSGSVGDRLQSWWTMTVCRVFGLRITITGELLQGGGLIVANHISWLDIPLLYGVSTMGFVAKAEINRWPIAGWIARFGNTVFHSRGSHDSARGVSEVMRERLKDGKLVTIFAEGGILPGHGVKPFHARLFAPAIECDAPIQPVMLRYIQNGRHYDAIGFLPDEHFMANFFRLLRQPPRQAEVALLEVIYPAGQQRKELARAAQLAVADAFDEGLLP